RPEEDQRQFRPPGGQPGAVSRGGNAVRVVPRDGYRRPIRRRRVRGGAAGDGGRGGVARRPARRRASGAGWREAPALCQRRGGGIPAGRRLVGSAPERGGPLTLRQQGAATLQSSSALTR